MLFGLFSQKSVLEKMIDELIPIYGVLGKAILDVNNVMPKLYEAGIYVGGIVGVCLHNTTTPDKAGPVLGHWVKVIASSYKINGNELDFDIVLEGFTKNANVYGNLFLASFKDDETLIYLSELLLKNSEINYPSVTNIIYLDFFNTHTIPFIDKLHSITVDIFAIVHKFAKKL